MRKSWIKSRQMIMFSKSIETQNVNVGGNLPFLRLCSIKSGYATTVFFLDLKVEKNLDSAI